MHNLYEPLHQATDDDCDSKILYDDNIGSHELNVRVNQKVGLRNVLHLTAHDIFNIATNETFIRNVV